MGPGGTGMEGEALWRLAVAGLHEITVLAAFGFVLLGLSDLLVDLIWLGREARRAFVPAAGTVTAADLKVRKAGPLAVFVPAWDESAVIVPMLRHALATFDHPHYQIYVGCYPNDPATIAAVESLADPRIRLVIGTRNGPTSKADCLNQLWRALLADEQAPGAPRYRAVVLHDAEDVVHSCELLVFDALLDRLPMIQLPVLPLISQSGRWVSAHYADEFAEAHGKELVVREAIGAGVPSAGVGCAIRRDALEALAGLLGQPFDEGSVTEDYELGLRLRALGFRTAFVRMAAAPNKGIVAVRAYFPNRLDAAVQQKSRWIAGIALSGWDRLGWRGGLAERWMRVRDRQAPLAAMLLLTAYAALAAWLALSLLALVAERPLVAFEGPLASLVAINMGLLLWRAVMRFSFTTADHGLAQGCLSLPRMLVSNLIAVAAAREAMTRYFRSLREGRSEWGKTAHVFPSHMPPE